jgi:predicted metal-dependent HD superfamily phosphohydrolase
MDLARMRQEWQTLLENWDVDSSLANQEFDELSRKYGGADRAYHTLDHVEHVLGVVHQLADRADDRLPVELAAWLHDVVYDSRASDNEERSAAYAVRLCHELRIPCAEKAAELILKTKTHEAGGDPSAEILLDADLAILGAGETEYLDYTARIRQEYAWVPEDEYRSGRTFVLNRFLSWPAIYHYLVELEAPARRNLVRETTSLQANAGA